MAKHNRKAEVAPATVTAQVREADSQIADPHYKEDIGWTRLTQSTKDMPKLTHQRHGQLAYFLWKVNPLAKTIIELTVDFCLGQEGISYVAPNPVIQDILDRFRRENGFAERSENQESLVRELAIFGEQAFPTRVNPVNGAVQIGYIDVSSIDQIKLDPFNKAPLTIEFSDRRFKPRKVIALDTDPRSETYGRLQGDCFLFQANKIRNAARGFSDLLSVIDWIDCYEDLLFGTVERSSFMSSFVWDVMVKGAAGPKIKERMLELQANPPKKGSFVVHNENEEWKVTQGDWRTPANLIEAANHIKKFIIMGSGYPEHFFQEEDVKVVAEESKEVGVRRIQSRQGKIKAAFRVMGDYAIDQAIICEYVKPDEVKDRHFEVRAPEISSKDISRISGALSVVTGSLSLAQERKWISDAEASAAFRRFMGMLGVDMTATAQLQESGHKNKTWSDYYAGR